jgi:hypothetical protein
MTSSGGFPAIAGHFLGRLRQRVQADPGAEHGCGHKFWSLSSPQSGIELQKG